MKLLLIEDNESIILGLEYLLREEGFACFAACTFLPAGRARRIGSGFPILHSPFIVLQGVQGLPGHGEDHQDVEDGH